MLALWNKSPQTRRRNPADAPAVELSESRLDKVIKALSLVPKRRVTDRADERPVPRVQMHADVTLLPFRHGRSGQATAASIHDISAAGVAVKVDSPLPIGTQFKLLIPRKFRRAIEVLCTARHCRASEGGFIIGAEYGVSWLETLGTLVGPRTRSISVVHQPMIDSDLAVA